MKQLDNRTIKILFIGDIVGKPGRRAVAAILPNLKKEEKIDYVFANGENLASGNGMTKEKYDEMMLSGIDYFTSGNHIWAIKEFIPYLDEKNIKVLRPHNYPFNIPGRGLAEIGKNILLLNLQGRVFMKESISDPFALADKIAQENRDKIIIVDIHAEATSEKVALGYYLDGKVSAVIGTHTHIQTADEKILPKGTACITDVGMTGPSDSVLGIEKEIIIERFLTQLPQSHKVASGESIFSAVVVEINQKTKKAIKIKRFSKKL